MKYSNKARSGTLTCIVAIVLGLAGHTSAHADGQTIQSNAVQFEQIAPFVKMGAAWGDRSQGAHGTFGRFPPGAASPLHTHSSDYHAIVIEGIMTNPFNEESSPPELGPGSYWYVPAGTRHVTACVSQTPCLFYFHATSAFDFSPSSK